MCGADPKSIHVLWSDAVYSRMCGADPYLRRGFLRSERIPRVSGADPDLIYMQDHAVMYSRMCGADPETALGSYSPRMRGWSCTGSGTHSSWYDCFF